MLEKTKYSVDIELLNLCNEYIITNDIEVVKGERDKLVLNEPVGHFFYDSWKIKDIYKGTPLEDLYNSLDYNKGEARIIEMEPGNCYMSHADIDNRWHINLTGEESFLIDLENLDMYNLNYDGIWWYMDAGRLHSASNHGDKTRKQLVVRELLTRGNLTNGVFVKLQGHTYNARFLFDKYISPWLNKANKEGKLDNFIPGDTFVSFEVCSSLLSSLRKVIPDGITSNV